MSEGADVTTKDLTVKGQPADFLCCGERGPTKLVQTWLRVCCGPVRWKSASHEWSRLLEPPV